MPSEISIALNTSDILEHHVIAQKASFSHQNANISDKNSDSKQNKIMHCLSINYAGMIPQGLNLWLCHQLSTMYSLLGSTIMHPDAWTIARNNLWISNKQKGSHLPKKLPKGWNLKHTAPSTGILQMISAKCIIWQSSKQLMFLTYHMHCYSLNIRASKQQNFSWFVRHQNGTTFWHFHPVLRSSSILQNNHWIQIQTLHVFIQLCTEKI